MAPAQSTLTVAQALQSPTPPPQHTPLITALQPSDSFQAPQRVPQGSAPLPFPSAGASSSHLSYSLPPPIQFPSPVSSALTGLEARGSLAPPTSAASVPATLPPFKMVQSPRPFFCYLNISLTLCLEHLPGHLTWLTLMRFSCLSIEGSLPPGRLPDLPLTG